MLTAIADLSFGDSGKGKIIDILSPDYDIVVRYAGGANAGHTVVIGEDRYALHLLPCGVVRQKTAVLANGMAIDPRLLMKEIQQFGAEVQVLVSNNAQVVMPWHLQSDAKKGGKIGTTCRGIGPAYADKMHRWNAIRMGNLLEKLESESTERFFASDEVLHGNGLWQEYHDAADFLQPYICDTGNFLRRQVRDGANILFEMANGIHLDIDHGTFPYVTSSGTGPAAIPQACGLPNLHLDRIVGVIKCHATRVGKGPFPSEIQSENDPIGCRQEQDNESAIKCRSRDGDSFSWDCPCDWCVSHSIREKGNEYGTTTGRPRRIGWFDGPATRRAVELTGATEIALMHADTLSDMELIGYSREDDTTMLDGWKTHKDKEFKDFVNLIQDEVGVPITMVSYGPERTAVDFL